MDPNQLISNFLYTPRGKLLDPITLKVLGEPGEEMLYIGPDPAGFMFVVSHGDCLVPYDEEVVLTATQVNNLVLVRI